MPRDLQQLLHDTAVQPSHPVDLADVRRRGDRRRRVRYAVVGLGSAALVVAAAMTGLGSLGPPTPPVVDEVPTEPATHTPRPAPTQPPSQSLEDAARDGVLPEVATLPFEQRVEVQDAVGDRTRRAVAEGVWVVSRLPLETTSLADGCGLGATDDPDAIYRRDVVCTVEYGEVLLLDHREERILRAFPLPGLPPQRIEVAEDAVWCARTGDGALSDSMLCRIDRQSLDWHVRVFPSRTGSMFTGGGGDAASGIDPATGEPWLPPHWTLHEGRHYSVSFLDGRWWFEGDTLVASSLGALRYHPQSLAPIPPCELDMTITASEAGNVVRLTTTLALADDAESCGFDSSVDLTLADADGWPLLVEPEAPGSELQHVITPDEPAVLVFEWSNWCDDETMPAEAVFDAGPFGQATSPVAVIPACEDADEPSRLSFLRR